MKITIRCIGCRTLLYNEEVLNARNTDIEIPPCQHCIDREAQEAHDLAWENIKEDT
jgi:hypothetical protein